MKRFRISPGRVKAITRYIDALEDKIVAYRATTASQEEVQVVTEILRGMEQLARELRSAKNFTQARRAETEARLFRSLVRKLERAGALDGKSSNQANNANHGAELDTTPRTGLGCTSNLEKDPNPRQV